MRELCPLASGAKFPFFGLLFARPENVFFGPPILHFLALSAVSDEFGHIFRAPENIFRAGIRAPEKGLAEAVLGNPGQKMIRGTKLIGARWACAVCSFQHCLRELAGFMVWIAIQFPLQQLAD